MEVSFMVFNLLQRVFPDVDEECEEYQDDGNN